MISRWMPGYIALIWSVMLCAFAQTVPLSPSANWFVNGDYVVGGIGLRGQGQNGFATGTITVPDTQPGQSGVNTIPVGADIVAAFLYWQTVEKSKSTAAGQNGFFNNYPITGTQLGNPNAPVSWSAGGCAGASKGTTTLRTYRADVRALLNVDRTASAAPLSYTVKLPDSGSNGGGTPLTLGATLIMIYQFAGQTPSAYPLRGIVFYDGAYAPSNASSTMLQTVGGFYDSAAILASDAKVTHIVGNGQTNKSEQVYFNSTAVASPYGTQPPFPGYYNGSWDNPTWTVGNLLNAVPPPGTDPTETTSVVPSATNSGCVSWAAVVFSTKVNDQDGDLLLDRWEDAQGYTDLATGQWVALTGANKTARDMFVEVDWLDNLDGSASSYLHTHLPQQASLDNVGAVFARQGINVHFDVGFNYQSSPYTIRYSAPAAAGAPGGNAITEQALLCTDGSTLCPFPGVPVTLWKGGFLLTQQLTNWQATATSQTYPLGAFQPGRRNSYHYVLFGHALGAPRSVWTATGPNPPTSSLGTLVSLLNSGSTATIQIQSASGFLKPGDSPAAGTPGFGDTNLDRIMIGGAIGTTALNGTYKYTVTGSTTANDVTTTTLTITTSGVPDGYSFSMNPNDGVLYEPGLFATFAGPTSTSGHSDLPGGDLAVTFGLWTTDDAAGCQPDPRLQLNAGQSYCNSQVGVPDAVTGTLLHELGHNFALTHGGGFMNGSPLPSSDVNCKPNYLSVMNYLFQIRGIPGAVYPYDLLAQDVNSLDETSLVEANGIGLAAPFTRWYGPPSAADKKAQSTNGGRYASRHCDGTPLLATDPPMVRLTSGAQAIDWNNNGNTSDTVNNVDINFDGTVGGVFQSFSEWDKLDLHQVSARPNGLGLSSGAGILTGSGGIAAGGGGIAAGGGGTLASGGIAAGGGGTLSGGGIAAGGGGIAAGGGGIAAGGGGIAAGGGGEQNFDSFNSTVDPPTSVTGTQPASKQVKLTWTAPGFSQIRKYYVWRAQGNFPDLNSVNANISQFSQIATVSGNPVPATKYTDTSRLKKTTYTYFVTDSNAPGSQSGASNPAVVTITF